MRAKKRSGFTGSNGRRQDMTTTSETAMRRRMPSDSNSGALNLRVPSALGNRCDAHVFAPLSAPDRRISAFSPRRSQPRSLSGVEEGPRTISCPCGECNQVLWLSVWCSMPCPYVVVCTCTIRLEKSYMYVPIAVRGKKLKELCSSLCGIDYNAILSS